MALLIGGRSRFFVVEEDDATYRVERGSTDVRVTHKEGLTFEEAVEYLRPKN